MSDTATSHLLTLLSRVDAATRGASRDASNQLRDALSGAPPEAGATPPLPADRVRIVYGQPWTNYQGTVTEPAVLRQYFVGNAPSNEWTCGVENVRLVVRQAEADRSSLRSVGSAWSSSPVSATPLDLIHCGGLSGLGPTLPTSDLAPGVDPTRIAHLQAGTVIQTVNETLERNGQSLQVMGGNGGQNIAGAAATGTHGSWIDRRALADTIHAVALVGAGGRRLWIEPASRPLTRDTFTAWGVFEIVRDDALFSAAQVHVGALGITTSLVLDVAPLYFIDFTRTKRPLDASLRKAIYHLDLSGLGFGDRRPAHFAVILNPYQLGEGQNGAFMETGFVAPPSHAPQTLVQTPQHAEITELFKLPDPWTLVADLLSRAPWLVPAVLEIVLPFAFPETHVLGPLSRVWPMSTGGPPLVSTEFAVPQDRVEQTLTLLLTRLDAARPGFYWPGVFGIRFGKKTDALLGFTRFDRWCTFELVYLRGVAGVDPFLRAFYAELRTLGVPHALHWGQVNYLTADQVLSDYGEQTLSTWHAARARLGAAGQTFANQTTNTWGLTGDR